MGDWLKLILLIGLGGAALTLGAALLARAFAEERRLARAFRKGLEGSPDAVVVAHGSGRGLALGIAARRIVTAWDSGGWRMSYPLDELLGAELSLDGQVAARAMRGEPRRLLERSSGQEQEVSLRFLFDHPGHPDFELALWPQRAVRGGPTKPREAVAEGKRWIARVETLLRRSGGALVLGAPAERAEPRSLQEALDLADDDDEGARAD